MSKVNTLLSQRLKSKKKPSKKMASLAQDSASGNLTSFSGVFKVDDLNPKERSLLEGLLEMYKTGETDIESDLRQLASITSEVRAITNQAALLHGERIKRAQQLLKSYKDGAFTAWLIATYGNRQTPYNFLQYFEFHQRVPLPLRSQLERMPRQAIYTLASRNGEFDQKIEIVEGYAGETKNELLARIRELFPLDIDDRRQHQPAEKIMRSLNQLQSQLNTKKLRISKQQKSELRELLTELLAQTDRL